MLRNKILTLKTDYVLDLRLQYNEKASPFHHHQCCYEKQQKSSTKNQYMAQTVIKRPLTQRGIHFPRMAQDLKVFSFQRQ